MHSWLTEFIDSSWEERSVLLPSGPREIWVRRFPSLGQAKAMCERAGDMVHKHGGALFLARTSPTVLHSAVEKMKYAEMGEFPEEEPWFQEVVVVRKIDFEDLLGFLDAYGFSKCRGGEAENTVMRPEAKALLRQINQTEEFRLMCIDGYTTVGIFLRRVPREIFEDVFEKVWEFNLKYFPNQLTRQSWHQTFLRMNGFSLGPT